MPRCQGAPARSRQRHSPCPARRAVSAPCPRRRSTATATQPALCPFGSSLPSPDLLAHLPRNLLLSALLLPEEAAHPDVDHGLFVGWLSLQLTLLVGVRISSMAAHSTTRGCYISPVFLCARMCRTQEILLCNGHRSGQKTQNSRVPQKTGTMKEELHMLELSR